MFGLSMNLQTPLNYNWKAIIYFYDVFWEMGAFNIGIFHLLVKKTRKINIEWKIF